MEVNKISLPIAYMIENLRSKGVTDQELLHQVKIRDVTQWEQLNLNFNFSELLALYGQNPSQFESIVFDGYQLKFMTIYGLKNLLRLKLNLLEEKDYGMTEKGITNLKVNPEQLQKIEQFLSANWVIEELESEVESIKAIKIELA